jgi:hypothetical protein
VRIGAGPAEAKTSAEAPWPICVARMSDAEKLKRTRVPGCLRSKMAPSWVNACVREEAANTVMSVALVRRALESDDDEPQELITNTARTDTTIRRTASPVSGQLDHHSGRLDGRHDEDTRLQCKLVCSLARH